MTKFLLLLTTVMIQSNLFSQEFSEIIKDDQLNIQNILRHDTLVYFGVDFSKLEIVDPKKVNTEELINKYFAPWLYEFDKLCVSSGNLQNTLNKKLKFSKDNIQMLFKKRSTDYVTFERNPMIIDSVKIQIRNYDLSPLKSGLGLVIIAETFDKTSENVYMNYVFFDIMSREIFWRLKVRGSAGGAGMTNHWVTGMERSFKRFEYQYEKIIIKGRKK